MSETLPLRVLTTASYEKSLDLPSSLRSRLPVPCTRTSAFDADSVRAFIAKSHDQITPPFSIRDPFSDGPLRLVDGPIPRVLCHTQGAAREDDRDESENCDTCAAVQRAHSKRFMIASPSHRVGSDDADAAHDIAEITAPRRITRDLGRRAPFTMRARVSGRLSAGVAR